MEQGRRDAEAWGGWMRNEEHASSSRILHTQHNRYRHTNHPAIPQQQGNHHSTQMDTDNLSKCAVQMPQNQWVKQKKEGKNRALQRKEYLALPSGVRDLEKRKQTQRKRTERRWTQRHANTTVVLSLCMLCMMANHDNHSKSKAFPSALKSFLLQETDNYGAAIYANIKLFTLKQPLQMIKYPYFTFHNSESKKFGHLVESAC